MEAPSSLLSYKKQNEFKFPQSWTFGKHLRKLKNLRKYDKTAKILEPDKKLKDYLDYLIKNGLEAPKVGIGLFQTKNGLPYPGIIAKEKLLANEIFIKIPKAQLLTTKKAFFSECQQIFEENPFFYHKSYHASWEDNILWTFLLYSFQKGKTSPWFHMVNNLSRDIDYLVFWPDEDIKLLEDDEFFKQAKLALSEYEHDYKNLTKILNCYPQIFKNETYSYENCKWIYIHLVSRCFGNYFKYVTMVPFAEFLNHECSDVYYDFTYNENNPSISEQSEYPDPKELNENDILNATSSDGTYYSEPPESDEEFNFEIQNVKPIEEPVGGDMNFNLKQEIKYQVKDIESWLFSNIDLGDNFSVFYAGHIYDRIKIIHQEFIKGTKPYFEAKGELQAIQNGNITYKNELLKYYKTTLKKKQVLHITQKQKRESSKKDFENDPNSFEKFKKEQGKQYFEAASEWEEDKFDHFVMKCSRHDQFEANSQVYFCYGRLSNRLLLMRYGIALEYNKYDHVHLKLEYLDKLQKFKTINEKINSWKNISKFKKFKIKRTKLNVDLLLFIRAQEWNYDTNPIEKLFYFEDLEFEIAALEKAQQIYKNFLSTNFSLNLEQNQKILANPNISYHQYFAAVFRVERQTILTDQIKLCQIIIEILKRVKYKNMTIEFAALRVHEYETSDEEKRNRSMILPYLNRLLLKPLEKAYLTKQHAASLSKSLQATQNAKDNEIKQKIQSELADIQVKSLVQQTINNGTSTINKSIYQQNSLESQQKQNQKQQNILENQQYKLPSPQKQLINIPKMQAIIKSQNTKIEKNNDNKDDSNNNYINNKKNNIDENKDSEQLPDYNQIKKIQQNQNNQFNNNYQPAFIQQRRFLQDYAEEEEKEDYEEEEEDLNQLDEEQSKDISDYINQNKNKLVQNTQSIQSKVIQDNNAQNKQKEQNSQKKQKIQIQKQQTETQNTATRVTKQFKIRNVQNDNGQFENQ